MNKMKLKCIGGRCDGMSIEVNEGNPRYRQGEAIRVRNVQYLSIADYPETEPVPIASEPYSIYIIDVLRYTHEKNNVNEIWFLRPANFTVFDCLQFAFNR